MPMNAPNDTLSVHLDQLRMALAQGTRSVCPIVKAALVAGCTKEQLMLVAAEVGPHYAKEAVQNALDKIGPNDIPSRWGRRDGEFPPGYHHGI